MGLEWKVTAKYHGETLPYSPKISKTSKIDEQKLEQKSETNEFSHQPQSSSVNNLQTQNKMIESSKTLTECYREIIEESGQPWLHIDHILVFLKKDYNIIQKKPNISSVLRQCAKNNRIFKFHGKNRFGLIEKPTRQKSVIA